jgi:hypothetical protein
VFYPNGMLKHDARGASFKSLLDVALTASSLPPPSIGGDRWSAARKLLLQDPHADIAGVLSI